MIHELSERLRSIALVGHGAVGKTTLAESLLAASGAITTRGTVERGKAFANAVRLCTLATSLGGVETILQHSASMTHSTIPREDRLKAGALRALVATST